MTHAGYLKLWQLGRPRLFAKYDAVMLDEAQDCSPVIAHVVLAQKCPRIIVGDRHQAIYGFTGAKDALGAVTGAGVRVRRLCRCFRFGRRIASAANLLLAHVKQKEGDTLLGMRPPGAKGGQEGKEGKDDGGSGDGAPRRQRRGWRGGAGGVSVGGTGREGADGEGTLHKRLERLATLAEATGWGPAAAGAAAAAAGGESYQPLILDGGDDGDHDGDDDGDHDGDDDDGEGQDPDDRAARRLKALLDPFDAATDGTSTSASSGTSSNTTTPCGGGGGGGKTGDCPYSYTLIARTNATLFTAAAALLCRDRAAAQRVRVGLIGGYDGSNFQDVGDIALLVLGRGAEAQSKLVKSFRTYEALSNFATEANAIEVLARMAIVEQHGAEETLRMLATIKARLVKADPSTRAGACQSDVTLTTVHKSKGLEWDRVVLADDFAELRSLAVAWDGFGQPAPAARAPELHGRHRVDWQGEADERTEDMNCIYVAMTRAKKVLKLNRDMCGFFDWSKAWDRWGP